MTTATVNALRAEAAKLLERAEELEQHPERLQAVVDAELARKGCSHVGPCNCGQPCACGRPGCTVPLGRRRHARYRDRACRNQAYFNRQQANNPA